MIKERYTVLIHIPIYRDEDGAFCTSLFLAWRCLSLAWYCPLRLGF